ncbi:siderophore-interacting protein [Corynebacterium uterequi]|uniref:Siderophore-interacting protein n=1 Tax=Corynebacterium uterequi TaxID=1072256 RepID=A0A0G3HBZ7_9CORY|nr:siderophore-interacting protein [Corynebacterium uterequi]AKK10210.1 siderophore-interacting protein [Corynebacterium uterequi]
MSRGITGAIVKALRIKDLTCTVTDIDVEAPALRAIRVSCPELIDRHRPMAGEFLHCWLPMPGHPRRQVLRPYSITDIDYTAGEFTIRVLLHLPEGPGTAWATTVAAGDTFAAVYHGSRPFIIPTPLPEEYVLVADASGIPYVNALAPFLAETTPVKVWLLDFQPSDHAIPLADDDDRITVEWVGPTREALRTKAQAADWAGRYPVIVSESKLTRALRRYLLHNGLVSKEYIYVRPFWAVGHTPPVRRLVTV